MSAKKGAGRSIPAKVSDPQSDSIGDEPSALASDQEGLDVPRIRSIKPSWWENPAFGQVEHGAILLFIGLHNIADDEGRGRELPKSFAGAIFPHDDAVTPQVIAGWLDDLATVGLIQRYPSQVGPLFCIPDFLAHQVINRPLPSHLPGPTHGSITEDSLRTHPGSDRIGSDRIGEEGIARASAPEIGPSFIEMPDTIEGVMFFKWRAVALSTHLHALSPNLSPERLWDEVEAALAHRRALEGVRRRSWWWPDGCVKKLEAWVRRAESEHLSEESAKARAAKNGIHVVRGKHG